MREEIFSYIYFSIWKKSGIYESLRGLKINITFVAY